MILIATTLKKLCLVIPGATKLEGLTAIGFFPSFLLLLSFRNLDEKSLLPTPFTPEEMFEGLLTGLH